MTQVGDAVLLHPAGSGMQASFAGFGPSAVGLERAAVLRAAAKRSSPPRQSQRPLDIEGLDAGALKVLAKQLLQQLAEMRAENEELKYTNASLQHHSGSASSDDSESSSSSASSSEMDTELEQQTPSPVPADSASSRKRKQESAQIKQEPAAQSTARQSSSASKPHRQAARLAKKSKTVKTHHGAKRNSNRHESPTDAEAAWLRANAPLAVATDAPAAGTNRSPSSAPARTEKQLRTDTECAARNRAMLVELAGRYTKATKRLAKLPFMPPTSWIKTVTGLEASLFRTAYTHDNGLKGISSYQAWLVSAGLVRARPKDLDARGNVKNLVTFVEPPSASHVPKTFVKPPPGPPPGPPPAVIEDSMADAEVACLTDGSGAGSAEEAGEGEEEEEEEEEVLGLDAMDAMDAMPDFLEPLSGMPPRSPLARQDSVLVGESPGGGGRPASMLSLMAKAAEQASPLVNQTNKGFW